MRLPSFELSAKVRDYVVTGTARFRADIHEWEPWLEITAVRERTNHRQRFDEHESPFYGHTFASRQAAAQFALWYGQRMVLGALRGLRI
jgi:predicted phosphoadenosine phosphosulfate sulfurtransferase